ncbi:hypothetical protein FRC02_003447 [Tulasnella sp. 418]|nr:hypothetical protein FRC02_003447 [Tulasnella sp. 418]
MIRYYLGALYPAKEIVEERLRSREGYTPMILDVGTGSGAWAVDMGLKFPHSEVIGLDIVPPVLRDGNLPSNCRFEIDDCNLSFTHWVNTFDFVHARSVDTAIHDFPTFLYNMAQIMRPGAVLVVGSGLPHFFDENGQPHPDVEEGEEG